MTELRHPRRHPDTVTAGLFDRFGGGMSPEELAEKAKRQLRDRFGRWKEERARLNDVGGEDDAVYAPRRVVTPVPARDIAVGDRIARRVSDHLVDRIQPRMKSGQRVLGFRGREIVDGEPIGSETAILSALPDALVNRVTMVDDDVPEVRLPPSVQRPAPARVRPERRVVEPMQTENQPEPTGDWQQQLATLRSQFGTQPTTEQHFAAFLSAGGVLNEELERRIQARAQRRGRLTARQRSEVANAEYTAKRAEDRLKLLTEDLTKATAKAERKALREMQADPQSVLAEPFRTPNAARVAAVRSEDPVRQAEARKTVERMNAAVADDPKVQVARAERLKVVQPMIEAAANLQQARTGAMVPGSKAYSDAQREEALAMLSEIRPMGGSLRVRGAVSGLGTAVDAAGAVMPTDWVTAFNRKFRQARVASGVRGKWNAGLQQMLLSGGDRHILEDPYGGGFGPTAVHEFAHGMEGAVPNLVKLQQMMLHHRMEPGEKTSLLYKPSRNQLFGEYAIADKWSHPYTGKLYDALNSPNPRSFEILSTGMESLMAGSSFFLREESMGGFDSEYRAFILAMMAML